MFRIGSTGAIPDELVSPGFSVEVFNPAVHFAIRAPWTRLDHKVFELSYLEAALQAEAAGVDAFFVNAATDYALAEMRTCLRIPVIAAGQAAMSIANTVAENFGIVTVWPSTLDYVHHEQLAHYGLAGRCTGIRNVTARGEVEDDAMDETSFVLSVKDARADVVERIAQQIRLAIDEDGAKSVVFGCTCMSAAARELAPQFDIPIVDPLAAGYRFTETTLMLGLPTHTADRTPDTLRAGRLAAIVAAATSPVENLDDEDACGTACAVLQTAPA
jgi:allantoin racemase